MTCDAYEKSLGAITAGDAVPGAAEHEKSCAACQKRRKSLEESLAAIAMMARPAVPAALAAGAMAKINTLNPPWQRPPTAPAASSFMGWATAVAVTVAAVFTFGHHSSAPRFPAVTAHSGSVKETREGNTYHVQVPSAAHATVRINAETVLELDGPAGLTVPALGPPFVESGNASVRITGAAAGSGPFRLRTPHLEAVCTSGRYNVTVGTTSTVHSDEGTVAINYNGRLKQLKAGEDFHPTSAATVDPVVPPSTSPGRVVRPQPIVDTGSRPAPSIDASATGHPVDFPGLSGEPSHRNEPPAGR